MTTREAPEPITSADDATASAVTAPTELTIVGTRASVPFPGDPSPGYLVRSDATAVLLDCGPGVAGALWTYLDPGELDAVVISHLHSDHCYDVLPLGKHLVHHRMRHGDGGRVTLLAPAGAAHTLRTLNELFPVGGFAPALDRVFDEVFDLVEYEPGHTQDVGGVRISLEPVRHAVACCAIRVDTTGGSVTYSGDTGWSAGLLRAALGADLLLCEATTRDSGSHAPHGHLSAGEAGRVAAQAGVHHLVLTHLTSTDPDWLDALHGDASAEFDGPVSVARPGDRFRADA